MAADAQSPDSIAISPVVPADISFKTDSGTVDTSKRAAIFAWEEFIALNWAAKVGFRDSADNAIPFGKDTLGVPLVWHTFRHKVEIYPGNNRPPHGYDTTSVNYGYNGSSFQPKYFYNPAKTGTADGQVMPFSGTPSAHTPWINLDETNEIGLANMYAGAGDTTNGQNQMLYMAKANKAEYVYAAKNRWYNGQNGLASAKNATVNYINANSNTPDPGKSDTLVSLPYGTIEVKTAWRKLTAAELASGKFYTDTVRYYVSKNKIPYYKDVVFGMVALHIIHKTPSARYFIFATFEQKDNILTTTGQPVEDQDGNIIANQDSTPLTPNFKVINATATQPMSFSPLKANAVPGYSLYYKNIISNNLLPSGTVRINKRINPIPQGIINVNQMAHSAISAYNKKNNLKSSVWSNYKLVNVQYKPINKPQPGVDYHGKDSANYYQANSVVESDYVLQKFSGAFSTGGTITDFKGSAGAIAYNAYNGTKNLMGGCMGCHGNATNGGTDYSFIFGSPVNSPEPAGQIDQLEASRKFARLFPFQAVKIK